MKGARINRGEAFNFDGLVPNGDGINTLDILLGLDSYTVTLEIFGVPEPEVLHFFAEDADHALEQALEYVGDLEVWPVVSSHVQLQREN